MVAPLRGRRLRHGQGSGLGSICPLIGTLPARCGDEDALAYIARQRRRHADGTGFSFAIADARTDEALGSMGLWLRDYPLGRAQAGYAVAPGARDRGAASDALRALMVFA